MAILYLKAGTKEMNDDYSGECDLWAEVMIGQYTQPPTGLEWHDRCVGYVLAKMQSSADRFRLQTRYKSYWKEGSHKNQEVENGTNIYIYQIESFMMKIKFIKPV